MQEVTPEFLRYGRNLIFAKHGYIFEDSCLNKFFNDQKWYTPDNKEVSFTDQELKWVNLIRDLEE